MEETVSAFKTQQSHALGFLERLQVFLRQGGEIGIPIDPSLVRKLDAAVASVGGAQLKVALIGGFSEGKTSIAAAWMEQLDRSSMKISHRESSNEVKVYEAGSDFVLIDTPGLFGFKEQYNSETRTDEKYREITKKYVSGAHLVLYVMNSTNPIKESHRDDLVWLFRTLNLLPRTVFVLSRFDEVADVEDEREYDESLAIKRGNVAGRLRDLVCLSEAEAADLSIVGVAANPFDMGIEHWLEDPDKFRQLSHIGTLQHETAKKIRSNGGPAAILEEARNSVVRDVLDKQLPIAVENDERIAGEVAKLETMSSRMQRNLLGTADQIADVRIRLRQFVVSYFSDLILQAKGTALDTFVEFFERQVGSEGIVVATRLQNEFERELKAVTLEVDKMTLSFTTDINHFNHTVRKFGKQGLDYVIGSKLINNTTLLAARDGLVTAAKVVGVDLGGVLKFKPWGATNLANGINGVFAVVGLVFEAWDSWDQMKRQEAFRDAIAKMVQNFEKQREELVALIDNPEFTDKFFVDYVELKSSVDEVKRDVAAQKKRRAAFQEWRQLGESIESGFSAVGT